MRERINRLDDYPRLFVKAYLCWLAAFALFIAGGALIAVVSRTV